MLRILLVVLLAIGAVALAFGPERSALIAALFFVLPVAFLLAGAKLAIDLIDLIPSDLAADAALLVLLGIAFTRITTANRLLVAAIVAAALATQLVPLVVSWTRPRAS
jgi:hypothetical protein